MHLPPCCNNANACVTYAVLHCRTNICISHAPSVRRLLRPHRITKNDKHLASSNKLAANYFLLAAPVAFKVSCFCLHLNLFFLSQKLQCWCWTLRLRCPYLMNLIYLIVVLAAFSTIFVEQLVSCASFFQSHIDTLNRKLLKTNWNKWGTGT